MYLSISFSEQNGKNCGSFMIGLILMLIMVYITKFSIIISLMIMFNQLYNIRERRIFRTYYSNNNKLYNLGTDKDFLDGFIYRITLNNTSRVLKRLSKIVILLNEKSYWFNKLVSKINDKLNDILHSDVYEAIISKQEEIYRLIYDELFKETDNNDNNDNNDNDNINKMYMYYPKQILENFHPYNWFNNGLDLSIEKVFLSTENEKRIELLNDDLLNKLLITQYLIVLIGCKINKIKTYKKAKNIHKAVIYGLNIIDDLKIMLDLIDNNKNNKELDNIEDGINSEFTMFIHNINIFVYDLCNSNFENKKISYLLDNYQGCDNKSYEKYKDLLVIFNNL